MKFLCPACQQLAEIASVRAQGSQVVFTCGACGVDAVQETPSAAPAPPVPPAPPAVVVPLRKPPRLDPETAGDPFFVPADRCPKCLAERSRGPACSRCGLLAQHAQAENFLPSPDLREQWRALWDRWDDPLAQEEFRRSAVAHGQMAQVGRLYQLRLARQPGDAQAERGRAELLRMVSSGGALERTQAPDTRRIRQLGWGLVMLITTLLAALVARGLLGR